MIRSIFLRRIQPLRGWEVSLSNNLAFHAGLLGLNPFGVLYNGQFVNTVSTKSPKNFNITIAQCSLEPIQKSATQHRKFANRIRRSELSVKKISTKSPKDFSIANPECKLKYLLKSAAQSRKPACQIWRSELSVKSISVKSPKDFNIANPECNSGYKQRRAGNPEGVE